MTHPGSMEDDTVVAEHAGLSGTGSTSQTMVLQEQVRALEAVVALERKLRRVQEEAMRAQNSKHASQSVPGNAPTSPAGDDDATVLVSRPAAEPTMLSPSVHPAEPVQQEPAVPLERGASPVSENTLALPIGFRLFEYRIDSVLGQGGFGITYLATDVNLNAKVAIKEYLPGSVAYRASDRSVTPRWPEDQKFYQHGLDSFLVEARTLATFRHPNIVRVARFFEAHRTAYMVLEYERGEPLKTWWGKHSGMQEQDLLALLQPLLDGLAVVHDSGYLHRDIKPDNVYVRREDGSLVLLDFGAARQTAGGQQNATSVVTPGYAPIEQYEGNDQGPWTDVYALGATLYWMVSGQKPIPAAERLDEILPMVSAEQAGQGRYSTEFLRAIDWALQTNPKDRPQDVHAFRRALYGAHAAGLGLQEALRAGDTETVVGESWRALINSPRLLKASLKRFGRAVARPASWPLAVKMTLAMVLAALLPMTITAYYNLKGTLASVSAGELRNLEQHAHSAAGRVSQLINDSRNLANYLGTDRDFVSFLMAPTPSGTESIRAKLESLAASNPDVHPLIVMNQEGTALVSNDAGVTGRNFKFREYFKEAMAGRPHMTGMVVGATAGAAGIYYSNPVRDPDGKVIGAVVLRIKGSTIASILGESKRGALMPFLIDGDGILIYHPDQAQLYRSLVPLSEDKLKQIVADQRFRRNKIESLDMPDLARAVVGANAVGNISYASTLTGDDQIAGFAPVQGHNWVVGVTESRQSFEEPLNRLFVHVLYSVALVGVVFLVLAILFARSIVRPIERLTIAAHALKSGDYEKANIKVTSDDEIGRLARTFNVMIDVLRQRDREQSNKRKPPSKRDDPLGLGDLDA
jgi:serine/threonine protein kinase/HAMP domain-containing protein